ncbi:MAG: hydroxymethylpyrimidine/phosphomethylpyrimidine kinase [Campylobacter sp.]|nr:hydroxymethylpyrimidine/phosphomethylpyrimidine kinase [Campylobacter sp.]
MKKNILIIAGSDSIGGAGIQADIKTCEAFACHSTTAIAAITAQNTKGVSEVFAISPELLNAQIEMIQAELDIHAIKIGMLFNQELIACVKSWLLKFKQKNIPIVLDPVCVAKSGAKLLESNALYELKTLLSFATIATPNSSEAEILGLDLQNPPCDILLKRTKIDTMCQDTLYSMDGKVKNFAQTLAQPEIMHGAGCSFSSALACGLANSLSLDEAITNAKEFIHNAISKAHISKFGKCLLNHKEARI